MKAPALWLALLLSLPFQSIAQECTQDDAGLENNLDQNIVTDSARTPEDHVNGMLNHFFMSNEGIVDFIGLQGTMGVKQFIRAIAFPWGTFDLPVTSCNEIGQCVQGSVKITYQPLPSGTATSITNGVLRFFSLGTVSFDAVTSAHMVAYEFSAIPPTGDEASTHMTGEQLSDYTKARKSAEIESEGAAAAADKRCRDNDGNLTGEENTLLTGGIGLAQDPNLALPTSYGYFLKMQTGWKCWPTGTGVACSRTYDWVWIDVVTLWL